MNWLLNMFSEFSEAVMGDGDAFERERRNDRKKQRGAPTSRKRDPRLKEKRGDRISDWDW